MVVEDRVVVVEEVVLEIARSRNIRHPIAGIDCVIVPEGPETDPTAVPSSIGFA